MPVYKITLSKTARKQLDKFPDATAEPLLKAIAALAGNPRPQGYKKLKGRDGYRIRQGDYRIIYDIIDKILNIDVISVVNRKDVYR